MMAYQTRKQLVLLQNTAPHITPLSQNNSAATQSTQHKVPPVSGNPHVTGQSSHTVQPTTPHMCSLPASTASSCCCCQRLAHRRVLLPVPALAGVAAVVCIASTLAGRPRHVANQGLTTFLRATKAAVVVFVAGRPHRRCHECPTKWPAW
jgi:hypothetical protein